MLSIISFTAICIITLLCALSTIKEKDNSMEKKTVTHHPAYPKFKALTSNPEDEREREVDRLLMRKRLSLAEQQYIYDFLMDTGKEKWRYIKGYEGFYRISTYGMIESCRYDKRYLNPIKRQNGSYSIQFNVGRAHKTYSIHKLVAETFIPNPSVAVSVRPKDGNYSNCDVRNLVWLKKKSSLNLTAAA